MLEEDEGSKKEKYLQISVIDTGVGIPYEDQDKLFQLFGFIEGTESMNKNGVGLGLIISEQIVHKFGGSIHFESEPDVGSTFIFTFHLTQ